MRAKPSLLLTTQLRADWEYAQQTLAAARYHLRRGIQIAVGLYAIGAFAIQSVEVLQPALPVLRLAALGLIFTLFTSRYVPVHLQALSVTPEVVPDRKMARVQMFGLCSLVLALVVLATLTMPHDLRPKVMQSLPFLPPALAVLIPVTTAVLFALKLQPDTPAARLLGLSFPPSVQEAVIGVSAGACLGLHFWVTYGATISIHHPLLVSFDHLVWLLSFTLGFQAIGEEIFFRGLLFRLYENERSAGISSIAPILLLNAFVYLLPGLTTPSSNLWLWRVVYGLAFAALATWLRDREGNLTAPVAANASFTVLMTLGGGL